MKKAISLSLAAMLLLSSCAAEPAQTTEQTQPAADDTTTTPAAVIEETPEVETDFDKYVSNTFMSTGNNMFIEAADGVTYRAYLPAEEYGTFEYKFYFSNTVDSTYDKGELAYVGRDGGSYKIEAAYIADGGSGPDAQIKNRTPVTFGGSTEKNVTPNETYWSDPVEFTLSEGSYIVWEWKITGTEIPCTNMSYLTSATADFGSGTFETCDTIPLPQLIGCNREVKYKLAAIGDSITQGCQTDFMEYQFWAAKISEKLGTDCGFWNVGLGWSRSSDAAHCGDWVERIKDYDTVIVAFGTNDIISGPYGAEDGNTAPEIDGYIRTVTKELAEAGCEVIIFSAPPQSYGTEQESTRNELNTLLEITAQEYGGMYFDFGGLLGGDDDPAQAKYGAHPNGEGGDVVSDAFVEEYKEYFAAKCK
ncbi:MAG: SGNH/GDSL hydrolase family protein [Ruminiclostridium sp.]|nr:SGNH/GDSL hydrolase family protein [Ruminiclostridium sp.]